MFEFRAESSNYMKFTCMTIILYKKVMILKENVSFLLNKSVSE